MCGIALSIGSFESREIVLKILNYQKSRGPDNLSIYSINELYGCLGHNRLNIVDQNPKSNQPFVSRCGNFIISFNGEIYNYLELAKKYLPNFIFKTKSDTEVLLELWARMGQESIQHLVGMFAFIIYAKKENKIYIVRDRYGVKPVYFNYDSFKKLTVSSELFALSKALKKNQEIDLNIIKTYVDYGFYDSIKDNTHIKNIKKLPAGSLLIYNLSNNDILIKRYWKYELISPKNLSEKQITELNDEIYETLSNAVKIRTRSSVPFVVNISGGVDSGALLALLNRNKSKKDEAPFICYHAKYDGMDGDRETENLRNLIKKANVECREISIKTDALKDRIDELVKICDGPIGGFATIGYYQLHQAINNDGYRLSIDGQGADEVFLGYEKYMLANNPGIHVDGTKNSYFSIFKNNNDNQQEECEKPVNNHIYNDLFCEKLPRNLRMNDRLSMASSVELRSPFLDHRLYEKTFLIPREYYTVNSEKLKYQIKKIYTEYYGIVVPNKNGKVTNQTESLLGENYWLVESSLSGLSKTFDGEIEFIKIKNKLNKIKERGIKNSFQLWRIIVANSIVNSVNN